MSKNEEKPMVDKMIFHYDLKAVSDNQLYCNNPKSGKGRFVSQVGKTFKKAIYDHTLAIIEQQDRNDHKYTDKITNLTDRELIVAIIHCSSWYIKSGDIRKKDIQNFNKALLDSIFEAFQSINDEVDDSQIWSYSANKIEMDDNGSKEYIEVIITSIEDNIEDEEDNKLDDINGDD